MGIHAERHGYLKRTSHVAELSLVTTVLPSGMPRRPWRSILGSRGALAVATVVLAMGLGGGVWVAAMRPAASSRTASAATRTHVASAATVSTSRPSAPVSRPSRTVSGAQAVITPGEASRVVARYWHLHEAALVSRDLPGLASLSSAAAKEWEQPAVFCGCLRVNAPRPLISVGTYVPRQTRYPAHFLATAQSVYLGAGWTELLVFTKYAAGRSWVVTLDSGFAQPPDAGAPLSAPSGYSPPVSRAQRQRAATVADALAAMWQQAKNTGEVPSSDTFLLTGETLSRVQHLTVYRQDQVQGTGLIGHYVFYVSSSDPVWQAGDAAGNDVACQPVREIATYTAPAGQAIIQDSGQTNWGPQVPPGRYRHVIDHDTWQTCFLIPPNPTDPITVFNQDIGGAVSVGIH